MLLTSHTFLQGELIPVLHGSNIVLVGGENRGLQNSKITLRVSFKFQSGAEIQPGTEIQTQMCGDPEPMLVPKIPQRPLLTPCEVGQVIQCIF